MASELQGLPKLKRNPQRILIAPTPADMAVAYRVAAYLQKVLNHTDKKMIELIERAHPLLQEEKISTGVWAKHREKPPRSIEKDGFWRSLIVFLDKNGIELSNPPPFLYGRDFCEYFDAKKGSRSLRYIYESVGEYIYFQYSSWHPGYIQSSRFTISPVEADNCFANLNEKQESGRFVEEELGVISTVEYFEGIAFARQNLIFFIMRECEHHVPKFCVINKPVKEHGEKTHFDALYGHVLKGSQSQNSRFHRSPVVLRRWPAGRDKPELGALPKNVCADLYPLEYRYLSNATRSVEASADIATEQGADAAPSGNVSSEIPPVT